MDLEKAYERVPREEVWKSGVAEKYVRVVRDMYEGKCDSEVCRWE